MTKNFTASIWQEGEHFVVQCLQVDVATQGSSEAEALDNLKEALELHFESPVATLKPEIREIVVNLDAA